MWRFKTAHSSPNKATYSEKGWTPTMPSGQSYLRSPFDMFYGFLYSYGIHLLVFGTLVYFAWALWTMDYSTVGSG
jgi:hypothetical protein